MKAVILAGGFGTRLSEETHLKPKPMVEIGGKPILWHILKIYSHFGINEFIICLGYKGYLIKEYFANYSLHMSDITFDFSEENTIIHRKQSDDWKVTLVDTGDNTLTGGRLLRVREYLNDSTFCFTYGDGVADINITNLINHHKASKAKATLTAVQPPGRYGSLDISGDIVRSFQEKPLGDKAWINGGFFILEPSVFKYISGDQTSWEEEPLKLLAKNGYLSAYKHKSFWQPMDTLRDRKLLQEYWDSGKAPWKVWK